MQTLAFSFTHDPTHTPGNREGCTVAGRIQFVNRLLKSLTPYSIPGPPLTPQDFVSYLVSQGIEVGIMPQGIGSADMDAWAVQNLRFDAGWVRVSDPHLFRTGSINLVPRSTKFRVEPSPRPKPSRSRLRGSTPYLVSSLRTTKRLTQVRWSQQREVICSASKERLWQFCRRSSVWFIFLSSCQSPPGRPFQLLARCKIQVSTQLTRSSIRYPGPHDD